MSLHYELYSHAGNVDYADWKDRGIRHIIFDKDGTLSDCNQLTPVEEVMDGLAQQEMPDIFPTVAIVSNNHNHEHVKEFSKILENRLGLDVLPISRALGHKDKPHEEMGLVVASEFGVEPIDLGVVGDRRLTDISFARNLGAGAAALCQKVGHGDVKWVPTLRKLESGIVVAERAIGVARRPSSLK